MEIFFEVSLAVNVDRFFDYKSSKFKPQKGTRVLVDFQNKKQVGVVCKIKRQSEFNAEKIKEIIKVLDDKPLVSEFQLDFSKKLAAYYHYNIGETINNFLPKLLRKNQAVENKKTSVYFLNKNADFSAVNKRQKKQQELLNFFKKNKGEFFVSEIKNNGFSNQILRELIDKKIIQKKTIFIKNSFISGRKCDEKKQLNSAQQEAYYKIIKEKNNFSCWLLKGVTGSGKTEVYLQLIENFINCNKQVLLLVPEIGLAPQTLQRFKDRFNAGFAVIHSRMTEKERTLSWLEIKQGAIDIIIGTRSVVFADIPRLGCIIIDEEHDSSYKQQDTLRYHARDVAVLLAKYKNIPIILGSATPSFESLYNVSQNRYKMLELPSRAGASSQPDWEVVDLTKNPVTEGLSRPLIERIKTHLEQKQQVLIFLNRRGFAPAFMCYQCGWIADCHRCDSRYTLHQSPLNLICHHCESTRPVPTQCPQCLSGDLHALGLGTEKLEQQLHTLFPASEIIRFDRDAVRKKGILEEKIEKVKSQQGAILLGTQMLAKGHHFPGVTLVAILDVDGMLFSSDFRAMEKGAQLLIQVGGRSGRGDIKGTVMLQTFHPKHPMIQKLLNSGYQGFAEEEMKLRKSMNLPPYSYMALFRTEAHQKKDSKSLLQEVKKIILQQPEISMAGPLPANMFKKQGRYRYQLMIQSNKRSTLHLVLQQVKFFLFSKDGRKLARNVRWSLDVDPQEMI